MSSAGQLVGGVVGGVIGFFTGGPAGALYGAQIGMGVGGLIDPPKGPVLQGPKLSDLSQQTAGFGVFLPRYHGSMTGHGTVFWIEGGQLKPRTRKTSSGGKGGGGESTVKQEYYTATFALALADTTKTGPIQGIRRIWTTTGLIYDAGSEDIETIIASNQAAKGFRFYPGSEDQMPDPRIEADLGVGNCPAWRGRSYIVFDDMELTPYGNSVAGVQVKVEIVGSANLSGWSISYTRETYSVIPAYTRRNIGLPFSRSPERQISRTTGTNFGTVMTEYVCAVHSLFGSTVYRYAPVFSNHSSFPVHAVGDVHLCAHDASCNTATVIREDGYYLSLSPNLGSVITSSNETTFYSWGEYAVLAGRRVGGTSGASKFIVFKGADKVFEYEMVSVDAVRFCVSDAGRLYVFTREPGTFAVTCRVFDASGWGLLGAYAIPVSINLLSETGIDCSGDRIFLTQSPAGGLIQFYVLSAADLSLLEYESVTGFTSGARKWRDGDLLYTANPSGNEAIQVFDKGRVLTSEARLADIIESECLQSVLLTAADIDVTAIDQEVRGYRIASQTSIRAALEPLQAAWPFDIAQRGYKIHFVPRGQASVMTIPAVDLDARSAGAQRNALLPVAREMDTQIPRRVEVQFADVDREYDTNQTDDERTTVESAHKVTLELPIALTGAEAAGMPEVLLRMYWLERRDIGPFRLPPSYRALDAGDVVTIEGGELGTLELRLTQVHLLSDGRLECMAKLNAAGTYTSNAVAPDSTATPPSLGLSGPSRYELLDIPLLTDEFNRPGWFAAMCGYTAGWPGGLLYRTPDGGQTWGDLQGWVSPVTMGTCRAALPAGRTDMVDAASVLQVDLLAGDLSSITLESLYNGGNLLAVGAPGRWEIVAVATVEQQADGSYVLTDFLRGLFGSEWAAPLHQAGDAVVALRDVDVAWIGMSSATIGQPLGYRGITSGRAIDSDTTRELTYSAVNLMPLSPAQLNGSRHPSTRDWTLTVLRRSRISAGWRNGVGVPLGEESEAYEIDIFSDGTFTTVVRTLEVATPEAQYTSAQQVADFGSNQATLHLQWYQMSAIVGRGFPLRASITRG